MGSPALLLCRRCGTLFPLPGHDADDETLQDLAVFRAAHEPHGLGSAERLPEPALFDGRPGDPMSTRWFRVASGAEVLLVRSWRTSIDEPCRFELAAGPPSTTECVDVDEPLVRRALDRHFYPHAIRPAKLERIVGAVRSLVARLDPNEIEIAFDDAMLPNTGIGPLPARLDEALLARCAAFLDAWELERLHGFVEDHRGADGALAIRVRRLIDRSAA